MQDKNLASMLDRRVQLLEPSSVTNDFNEEKIEYIPRYSKFPAHRSDSTSTKDENQENRLVKGSVTVEWILRFIPGLDIRTDWRIKDIHDGKVYNVISPATEIGRRKGIRVLTEIVQ